MSNLHQKFYSKSYICLSLMTSLYFQKVLFTYYHLGQVYNARLERQKMLIDLLKRLHILKQLNDFNGVLSNVPLQRHLIELLEASLDLPKLRNESHLRTQDVFVIVFPRKHYI